MGAESVGRRHVTLQQVRADIASDELKRVFGGLAQCVALNITFQEAKEEKLGFRVQQIASGKAVDASPLRSLAAVDASPLRSLATAVSHNICVPVR